MAGEGLSDPDLCEAVLATARLGLTSFLCRFPTVVYHSPEKVSPMSIYSIKILDHLPIRCSNIL